MPGSGSLADIECSAEERAEAERLCRAEGVDPRGSKRGMGREGWVADIDAPRARPRRGQA